MRTTLNLDDGVMHRAKQTAARSGRTLTAIIEDALRLFLDHQRAVPSEPWVGLAVFDGGGLRPGVNLDSNADLLDLMDEGEPLHHRR